MSLIGFGEVRCLLGSLAAPQLRLPAGPQVARFRELGTFQRLPRIKRQEWAEVKQHLDILLGEHWDNDTTHRGGANVAHWASVNDGFSDAPIKESP